MMYFNSKEPKLYNKDMINKNIESLNIKLLELENTGSNIIESLKYKLNEIKKSVADPNKEPNDMMYIKNLKSQINNLKNKNNIISNILQKKKKI